MTGKTKQAKRDAGPRGKAGEGDECFLAVFVPTIQFLTFGGGWEDPAFFYRAASRQLAWRVQTLLAKAHDTGAYSAMFFYQEAAEMDGDERMIVRARVEELMAEAKQELELHRFARRPIGKKPIAEWLRYYAGRAMRFERLATQESGDPATGIIAGDGLLASPPPRPDLSIEALALAALKDHPDWPMARIAEAAGCERQHLYRLPMFMAAKAMLKDGKADIPRGRKDKDGNLEAWHDPEHDSE